MSTGTTTGAPPEVESPRVRRDRRSVALSGPLAIAALGLLVLFPLGMIFLASWIDGTPVPGAGADYTPRIDNYSGLWSVGTLVALRNSVVVGVGGTALAVAIGGTIAWLTARTDVPMRRLIGVSGVIPLFVPALVGAVAWSLLAAPDVGYLSLALNAIGIGWQPNVYSLPGMIFVFALYNVPYAFIFINNALNLMNAELEEAAAVHGAGRLRIWLQTTLPLAKPALLSAALLTFVLIIEDFPIAMILGFSSGIETMSSRVYILMTQAPPQVNTASALGVVLMLITLALVFLQRRLLRGQSFATVTGKGLKATPVKLGGWKWLALGFVAVYLGVAVVLPLAALFIAAVQTDIYTAEIGSLLDPSTMSLETAASTLGSFEVQAATLNTLAVGLMTVVFGIALSYFLAHLAHARSGSRLGRSITALSVLPAAVPGVVLGLGMLWAFTALPLLYGTLTILVLAFVARFLPQGVGNMSSAIQRIHPDLEESARVSGAGKLRSAIWVTAPLLRSSLFSTGLLMFVLSMRELSASVFLYTSSTKTLPIHVFDLWSNGTFAPVAAISLAYSLFLLLVVVAGRKWLNQN